MAEEERPERPGAPPSRLVAAKMRRAAQARGFPAPKRDATGEARLPPGQRRVKNWPVLDLGVRPDLTPGTWRLEVSGLVARPLAWDLAALMAEPQAEKISDIHCVTAWSRFANRWQGVEGRHVAGAAGALPAARYVLLESYDGYTTNVPRHVFEDPDTLLAHHWEGRPLAPEHGGPVRLVIPRLYFWKSAKWIRRIVFVARDRPGFWEVRGYHNDADPWREQRYGRPPKD